jgi:hypothetical protein
MAHESHEIIDCVFFLTNKLIGVLGSLGLTRGRLNLTEYPQEIPAQTTRRTNRADGRGTEASRQSAACSDQADDALASGAGRVECLILPHRYDHPSPVVEIVESASRRPERLVVDGDVDIAADCGYALTDD